MSTFNRGALVPCDAASFAKNAVDLARFLLGRYLFCPQYDMGYVRIIETEAYPVDDEVYGVLFGEERLQREIPDRAGVLFRMNSRLHHPVFRFDSTLRHPSSDPGVECRDYLYITAKGSGEAGATRPVVLIRSCMLTLDLGPGSKWRTSNPAARRYLKDPQTRDYYCLKNLLVNPHTVGDILEPDLRLSALRDPILYVDGGCRLFSCTDPLDQAAFGHVLCGKRVLVSELGPLQLSGLESNFRFLLVTDIHLWYFQEPIGLIPITDTPQSHRLAGPSQVVTGPYGVPMGPTQAPMDSSQEATSSAQAPTSPS